VSKFFPRCLTASLSLHLIASFAVRDDQVFLISSHTINQAAFSVNTHAGMNDVR
jgi:hypothetical protein